ncbi:MAG: hypothetical protein M0P07_01545 [Candidatus Methanomethylophilaceae archaeon]|nr:hypothetical protein [Candidatus Methanomethylophilaceae archaeon]MDD3378643.1 hypothetical protein [Candidatus Methanomethylophilaceae archaeon]
MSGEFVSKCIKDKDIFGKVTGVLVSRGSFGCILGCLAIVLKDMDYSTW